MNSTHHSKGRMPKQARRRTGLWIALASGVLLVFVGVLVAIAMQPESTGTTTTSTSQPKGHFMDPNQVREIRIVKLGEDATIDPGQGVAVVTLLAGSMPNAGTTVTVATDTDCAPDPNGVSHCHNELNLSNGSKLTIQHHHKIA